MQPKVVTVRQSRAELSRAALPAGHAADRLARFSSIICRSALCPRVSPASSAAFCAANVLPSRPVVSLNSRVVSAVSCSFHLREQAVPCPPCRPCRVHRLQADSARLPTRTLTTRPTHSLVRTVCVLPTGRRNATARDAVGSTGSAGSGASSAHSTSATKITCTRYCVVRSGAGGRTVCPSHARGRCGRPS